MQLVKKPWLPGQAVLDILILDLQVKVSSFRQEELKLHEKGGEGLRFGIMVSMFVQLQ